MRRLSDFALALTLVALAPLAACGPDGPATEEVTAEERRAVRLDGRQLVLDGFAGDVSVTAVPGLDEVEVVFTKRAKGATEGQAQGRLEQIRIEEAGDGELYQFVWRTDLEGTVRVDAEARVPLAADVVVRLGAGEITANGLRGPFDAETGAGDLRADHLRTPSLTARTGSGDLTLGAAFLPPEARWTGETGSGDLVLQLAPSASARVRAESGAGGLDLDPRLAFSNVRQSGDVARVGFQGTLGAGQARVDVNTGAGDVELLRYTPPAPESEAAQATTPVRPDSARRDTSAAPEARPPAASGE